MINNDLVKKEIEILVNKEEMFTSVDISNEIKKKGIWLSNTETSNIMKDLFNIDSIFDSYANKRLVISDGKGTNVNAIVYYPSDKDPINYKKFTISITPAEFDLIKNNQVSTLNNVKPIVNKAADNNVVDKIKDVKVRKPRVSKKKVLEQDSKTKDKIETVDDNKVVNAPVKFSKSNRDYSKLNFIKIR